MSAFHPKRTLPHAINPCPTALALWFTLLDARRLQSRPDFDAQGDKVEEMEAPPFLFIHSFAPVTANIENIRPLGRPFAAALEPV